MALTTGTRVGPYEITGLLGEGAMGQVYRAQDTKLQRDVALKILPDAFVHDPDRLARFTREAQVLASLNHPHIGAIYGFEDSGPIHALVLELVEGPTLADWIAQGPVPIDEALAIARQIAEALEAAHEHGIVHRDLKPANIKVREDGTVKVLDFGLAKLTREDDGSGPMPLGTQSPTVLSPAMTTVGVILGTAAYMSPEQAKGKPADKRSDVWAFGCVLYEMLTGRRAFEGEDVSDTLAAVLRGEPNWAALPPTVSETLRTLLRNCLEKDRRKRVADISTAFYVMNAPDALRGPAATPGPARRTGLIWSASAAMMVAGIAIAIAPLYRLSAPDDMGVYRSSIIPPANLTGDPIGRLAISPDGRRLAFVAPGPGGPNMLWVRPLDGLSEQPLAGTEGAIYPFWSYDGRYLAFNADGQLKKIDSGGGAVTVLTMGRNGARGSWNQDDVILFNRSPEGELFRISAGGGTPVAVTALDRSSGQTSHRHPFFLPDGRRFLFVAYRGGTPSGLYVGSIDGDVQVRLLEDAVNAAYAQGYLLFVRNATLLAQPFDVDSLTLTGEAQPIAERVLVTPVRAGLFSVSQRGALVYQTSDTRARLGLVNREGSIARRFDDRDRAFGYSDIQFSPDGARAAFTSLPGNTDNPDVWMVDIARAAFTRLTSDPASDQKPLWSPDGSRLLFQSNRRQSGTDLFERSGNAGSPDMLLLDASASVPSKNRVVAVVNPSSWSPDRRFVLYSTGGPPNLRDLWVLPLEGARKPFPYLVTQFSETDAEFSPDGKWVAFASNESGRLEVYVDTFPEPTGKTPVSTNGGRFPRWRRDGRELFYENRDAREILSVSVASGSRGLEIGPAQRLFGYFNDGERKHWDVTPDGQMFLLELNNLEKAEGDAAPITLVVNWTAQLRR